MSLPMASGSPFCVGGLVPMLLLLMLLLLLPLSRLHAHEERRLDDAEGAAVEGHEVNRNCREESEALLSFYEAAGGADWTDNSKNKWGTEYPNGCRVESPTKKKKMLPDHCCWTGVLCCTGDEVPCYDGVYSKYGCDCNMGYVTGLDLNWMNMSGPLPMESLLELNCHRGLRLLDFRHNQFTGTIPASISSFKGLQVLNIAYNRLVGQIPAEMADVESLTQLDLTFNRLSGTAPQGLCSRNKNMTHLLLGQNSFNGTFSIRGCSSLLYLGLSNNKLSGLTFEGVIPLVFLELGYNLISGSIPPEIVGMHSLSELSVPYNKVFGSLPDALAELRGITKIRLEGNNMTGTLPVEVFKELHELHSIDMSDMWISGTIPWAVGKSIGLNSLLLRNNSLYGTIPETLSSMAMQQRKVDLSLNYLSCCGIKFEGNITHNIYEYVDYSLPRLPSFLKFSTHLKTLRPSVDAYGFDTGQMSCPAILPADAPDEEGSQIHFDIDSEYYLYDGCSCENGYKMERVYKDDVTLYGTTLGYGNIPSYICVKESRLWLQDNMWAAVLIPFAILLVPVSLLYWCCVSRSKRSPVVQWYMNLRKRTLGEPTEGDVHIVTIRVDRFEHLSMEFPNAMGRGLRILENVVRKCAWNNFGYMIEQPSATLTKFFSVAFHEGIDAVVFSLQLQMALQVQEWPKDVLEGRGKKGKTGSRFVKSLTSKTPASSKASQRIGRATPSPSLQTSASTQSTATSWAQSDGRSDGRSDGLEWRYHLEAGYNGEGSTSPAPPSIMTHTVSMWSRSSVCQMQGQMPGQMPSVHSPGVGMRCSEGSTVDVPWLVSEDSRSLSSALRARMQMPSLPFYVPRGVVVAVGIVMEGLKAGEQVGSSYAVAMGKTVAGIAQGGQVLMDRKTFEAVKDRLEELGRVDQNGLKEVSWKQWSARKWLCEVWKSSGKSEDEVRAPVLDMGCYVYSGEKSVPLILSLAGDALGGAGDEASELGSSVASQTMQADMTERESREDVDGTSLASAAEGGSKLMFKRINGSNSKKPPMLQRCAPMLGQSKMMLDLEEKQLHLYQIQTPSLSARVHHFGNRMNLEEEWVCIDPPYFKAPGTYELDPNAPDGINCILPPAFTPCVASVVYPEVTMVFCSVDGAKNFSRRAKRDTSRIHRTCVAVIRNTLRQDGAGWS